METKKIGDLTVNDGGGLFDSSGLIDTLIIDCNELPKDLMTDQNIRFCNRLVQMVQKLHELKNGLESILKSKDEVIAELNKALDEQEG